MIISASVVSSNILKIFNQNTTRSNEKMNGIAPGTRPWFVDSDSDTVRETKCTKIPSFLNRFKSRDAAKANGPIGEKKVFIRFRYWRRKKRKGKKVEIKRSEQECKEAKESNSKTDWEIVRHPGRVRFNRNKYGGGVVFEDENQDARGLPMRYRIKTRFAKIMRRRQRRSTATRSFYSMHCSHSRRSVDLKKPNFAVGAIMRPLATLKARKSKRPQGDFSDGYGKPTKKFGKAKKTKHVTPAVEKCRRWLDEYSVPGGSRQVDDPRSYRFGLSEPFASPRARNNFKQKFFRVLKKFKKAGVMEDASIAKKLSSGDTGALEMIEDLMDKLSLGKSSQYFEDIVESLKEEDADSEMSLCVITQAKPTLIPYFTENKLVHLSRRSITRKDYCERCCSNTTSVTRLTAVHQSYSS